MYGTLLYFISRKVAAGYSQINGTVPVIHAVAHMERTLFCDIERRFIYYFSVLTEKSIEISREFSGEKTKISTNI